MSTDTIEQVERPDWMLMTAKRLNDLPDGWKWYELDARDMPDDFFKMVGDVPIGVITRGINKGHPKFAPKTKGRSFFLRMSQVEETKKLWEAETGKCSKCDGTGREQSGYSWKTGHSYVNCGKCDGNGKTKGQ